MADRLTIIAHRGFARANPENTLPAIRAANPIADAIEVDVRACADGIVACHDPRVDRVTDATGRVREMTARELQDLSVQGSGAGVPTLEAVLEAVAEDVTLILDIKEPAVVRRVISLIQVINTSCVVSSFEKTALATAATVAPDIPRALILDADVESGVAMARSLECQAVHPELSLCLPGRRSARALHRWLGRGDRTARWLGRCGTVESWGGGPRVSVEDDPLDTARSAGLAVNAWTVRTCAQFRCLAARGVDGVAIDDPRILDKQRG